MGVSDIWFFIINYYFDCIYAFFYSMSALYSCSHYIIYVTNNYTFTFFQGMFTFTAFPVNFMNQLYRDQMYN